MSGINSSNVLSIINSFKTTVDNDTILFTFKESEPLCVSREYMYKSIQINGKNEFTSFYRMVVLKYLYNNTLINHFYKNKNGYWINIPKMFNSKTSTTDVYEMANNPVYYEGYIIDKKIIPKCDFIDSTGRMHHVDKGDGDSYEEKRPVFINEVDPNTLSIEQCSIDTLSKLGNQDHLKNDIKIIFKDRENIDNVLVWLNGIFISYEKKTGEDNIIYIRGGKEFMVTKPLTVDEAGNDIYYYRPDLRIFKWEGINVSNLIPTKYSKTITISSERYSMSVINELFFEEEINHNAHIILCNGQVLDKSSYTLDPDNKKHIILNNIKEECEIMINEIKSSEEYRGDPFVLLAGIFKNKYYTLVNFYSELDEEEIYLDIEKPLSKGYPSRFDVIFRDINPKDLILMDGLYFPYLINRNWYISYPVESHIYMTKLGSGIQECNIYKIRFIKEKDIINYQDPVDDILVKK